MPWEDNNHNPWGKKPSRPAQPSGGNDFDFEEILRKGQRRLRELMGGPGSRGAMIALLAVIFIWMLSGFYRVQEDEQGVVLRFGEWVETTQPGLNYHLPWPIETVVTPTVERINEVEIGGSNDSAEVRQRMYRGEGELPATFMLAGDEAFVDVEFNLAWKIRDAGKYLFNIREAEGTIITAADSAMREIISQIPFQRVLNEDRSIIERTVEERLQEILDSYDAGIEIIRVQLDRVEPPSSSQYNVLDAYYDVQRAREDLKSARNKAEAYRNDILPRARGLAVQMLEQAKAYRQGQINRAKGDADRFKSVLAEYRQAKDVTRKRLYLEAMEEILQNVNKVIIDQKNGVMPFLPLPEIQKRLGRQSEIPAPALKNEVK